MAKILKVFQTVVIGIMMTALFSSCLKNYNSTIALPEIGTAVNVIPEEIRDEFESKMDIYEGTTPPDITCSFVIAENELYYSSDGFTANFNDHYMKFYNKRGNRYQFKARQVESRSEASDVVVIGSGDNFTAYFTTKVVYDDGVTWFVSADLVSGTMSSNGIRNIKHAFIMLEVHDPKDVLMEENEYRIFYDGDGLASFVDWDDTKAYQPVSFSSEVKSSTAKLK